MIYFCVTNFHRLRGLKQLPFTSSQLCRCPASCCSGCHKADIKASTGLNTHMQTSGKIFQAYSCWQNSVPGSCRTKVPVSCWQLLWGCSQIRDVFLAMWPLPSSSQQQCIKYFLHLRSLTFRPRFKELLWLGQAHPHNLSLKVNLGF